MVKKCSSIDVIVKKRSIFNHKQHFFILLLLRAEKFVLFVLLFSRFFIWDRTELSTHNIDSWKEIFVYELRHCLFLFLVLVNSYCQRVITLSVKFWFMWLFTKELFWYYCIWHTVGELKDWTNHSVWSKITLITSGVSGAGRCGLWILPLENRVLFF